MRVLVVSILCLLVGCSRAARPAADRSEHPLSSVALKVWEYDGAAGRGHRVEIVRNSLAVVWTNDFGMPEQVIWSRKLTEVEAAFVAERINGMPLASLRDEYSDPQVADGLQIHFEVRQSFGASREIWVANQFVEELAALCDVVNVLLPTDHRLHYREWKWWEDVEAKHRLAAAERAS